MKRVAALLLCMGLLCALLPGWAVGVENEAILYVSPDGNDGNMGDESAPLATMAGARDRIREMKAASGLPEGGLTVYIRGGAYPVEETVTFDEADSGTDAAPIRYAAYPGEIPVFTGGSYIPGADFVPVAEEAMLARLAPEARDQVLCYSLFENGFSYDDLDYAQDFWQAGDLREHVVDEYRANEFITPRMQIFIDDDALYPARYPNVAEGIFIENPYNQYLMIQEVVESGFDLETEQPNGKRCAFRTYEDRIKDWKTYEDVVIVGMTGWEFFQSEVVAESIDPETMTITLRATPTSGVMERARYAFANVFEELDRPGEYYIDKNTGILYLYPTKEMQNAQVKISRFEEDYMIWAQGASNLSFDGLTFELSKQSILHIVGGENCAVENCTLKNYGIDGVKLGDWVVATRDLTAVYGTPEFQEYLDERSAADNGLNHRITGCTFLNTGRRAAILNVGNAGYREPGGAVFEGNLIKHSGLIGSCYYSGIVLNGCGITVRNNAFLFCRGQAINGNIVDTDIVYNEFCDSPSDMAEDTCSIYINYQTINDGVQIRHNYFHDITNMGHYGTGFDFARRAVAGYDNCQPFRDFSYNVVYNAPTIYSNPMSPVAASTTVGNVFIDCDYVMDYPDEYIRDWYQGETGLETIETLDTLPNYYLNGLYKDPLWREKYPELYEFYEYMASEKQDLRPVMAQVYNNLIVYLEKKMSGRANELPETVAVDAKYGRVGNNHFLYADPGFADGRGYDFQLSEETAAEYSVEWLDMDSIGLPGGLTQLKRVSDRREDPLWDVSSSKYISVELQGGEPLMMVSLWREVQPGKWVWFFDSALFGELSAGFPVKPGSTYTAYYHGDADHPAQFIGGLGGETPPEGVQTFTVESDQEQWVFSFALKER